MEGTVVGVLRNQEVGHFDYSLSAVAGRPGWMLEHCSCCYVGIVLVVDIDFVGVDFERVELGAGGVFGLQPRFRQRLSLKFNLSVINE